MMQDPSRSTLSRASGGSFCASDVRRARTNLAGPELSSSHPCLLATRRDVPEWSNETWSVTPATDSTEQSCSPVEEHCQQGCDYPVDTITTPKSLISFTTPPSSCAVRCWRPDGAAQCPFHLDAEELELARRYAEPLRVGHHAITVKNRQDPVFSIEQRIHLLVDSLHITAKRLSKRHD
jgi:hypothetical protein